MTIEKRLAMTFCRCEGRPLLSLRGTLLPKQSDALLGLPPPAFAGAGWQARNDNKKRLAMTGEAKGSQ